MPTLLLIPREEEKREWKEREDQEQAVKMTDPDEAHRMAMKNSKTDLIAAEKAWLTQLELTIHACLIPN